MCGQLAPRDTRGLHRKSQQLISRTARNRCWRERTAERENRRRARLETHCEQEALCIANFSRTTSASQVIAAQTCIKRAVRPAGCTANLSGERQRAGHPHVRAWQGSRQAHPVMLKLHSSAFYLNAARKFVERHAASIASRSRTAIHSAGSAAATCVATVVLLRYTLLDRCCRCLGIVLKGPPERNIIDEVSSVQGDETSPGTMDFPLHESQGTHHTPRVAEGRMHE